MNRKLEQEVLLCLKEKGYVSRIVSTEHINDLKSEIESRYNKRLFNEGFYKERLTGFLFQPPDNLANAKSLIVVAAPQPQFKVIFNWNKTLNSLIIPPTYLYYSNREVQNILKQILIPNGYNIAQTLLPLKLLAVRSGLGKYGKNNICYVPKLGSFHRLMAFYSDLPCSEDNWQEAKMMEQCPECSACLRNCPTGAISSDRFLLHAERCITFHNERKGDFPQWINPLWHHALVGCLYCQKVCPENKALLEWNKIVTEFTEDETALLLRATPFNQLESATVEKLKMIDWTEDLDIFARNLNVLLKKSLMIKNITGSIKEKQSGIQ